MLFPCPVVSKSLPQQMKNLRNRVHLQHGIQPGPTPGAGTPGTPLRPPSFRFSHVLFRQYPLILSVLLFISLSCDEWLSPYFYLRFCFVSPHPHSLFCTSEKLAVFTLPLSPSPLRILRIPSTEHCDSRIKNTGSEYSFAAGVHLMIAPVTL